MSHPDRNREQCTSAAVDTHQGMVLDRSEESQRGDTGTRNNAQHATPARDGTQSHRGETKVRRRKNKRAHSEVATREGQGRKAKSAKRQEGGVVAGREDNTKREGTRKRLRELEAPGPKLGSARTRRRTGGMKGLMEMTGTNGEDGYLYSSRPRDTDALRVGKAKWISEEAWGVFASADIRANTKLTPYAGEIRYASYEDMEPGGSSHVITLMRGINRRVFGLREPRPGFGVGSLVNDGSNCAPGKPAGATPNAEIVIGAMGDSAHVKATRNIKRGDEILIRYGRTYWHRARDEGEAPMDRSDDESSRRAAPRLVGGGKAADRAQPKPSSLSCTCTKCGQDAHAHGRTCPSHRLCTDCGDEALKWKDPIYAKVKCTVCTWGHDWEAQRDSFKYAAFNRHLAAAAKRKEEVAPQATGDAPAAEGGGVTGVGTPAHSLARAQPERDLADGVHELLEGEESVGYTTPEWEAEARARLGLTQTYAVGPILAGGTGRWWSPRPQDRPYGATGPKEPNGQDAREGQMLVDFLRDRSTWAHHVHKREWREELVRAAREAAATATRPTRIAILLEGDMEWEDTTDLTGGVEVRTYDLQAADPGQVRTWRGAPGTKPLNAKKLRVRIVESDRHMTRVEAPAHALRYATHLRPALRWWRVDGAHGHPNRAPAQREDTVPADSTGTWAAKQKKRRKAEASMAAQHPILWMLGIIPRGTARHWREIGINEEYTTPTHIHRVRKALEWATQQIYHRHRKYMEQQADRKGDG